MRGFIVYIIGTGRIVPIMVFKLNLGGVLPQLEGV